VIVERAVVLSTSKFGVSTIPFGQAGEVRISLEENRGIAHPLSTQEVEDFLTPATGATRWIMLCKPTAGPLGAPPSAGCITGEADALIDTLSEGFGEAGIGWPLRQRASPSARRKRTRTNL